MIDASCNYFICVSSASPVCLSGLSTPDPLSPGVKFSLPEYLVWFVSYIVSGLSNPASTW